jgi:OOP family OmpA-OmpF porin
LKKVVRTLGVALLAALAVPADAKDYSGEVGVFGGWVKQDSTLSGADQEIGDSSPTLGGRLGFLLSDQVGWFAEARHTWIGTFRPEGRTGTYDLRSGLELYGPELWKNAPLYIAGAGGLEYIDFDSGVTVDRPIISGGLGQRIGLTDNVHFRWEGRVTHAFEDLSDIVRDEMTHYDLNLGLSLTWGGSDTDGDGVKDGLDACPDTPKGANVDARGCSQDGDGDGIEDSVDQCPDTPKGARVDATGCPTDADGDGVWDGIDQCPNTPANTQVDVKGCPALFEKERDDLVLQGVNFETNKAVLLPASRVILDNVAGSLKAWPEIRVEVGGYTDSRGSDAYNLKLSTERAAAVRDYLMSRGVSADQLTSKGYGEANPVADDATDDGRAKNRRVELRKI